ncbi:MAG: hypothetical protein C4547_10210 [Phycisphaerales bacterium]|nr:MAG: hypothetical protein C4547_10210 [Phycisphaerales bacterium]
MTGHGLLVAAAAMLLTSCVANNGNNRPGLSLDDVPGGVEPITTFNGEWLSREFSFAFRITDHVGRSTLPSSDAVQVGDIVLIIDSAAGNTFRGRQIFSDGSIQDVVGTLTSPTTLDMVGGGVNWTMERIDEVNLPPLVEAGPDQRVTPDESQVVLAGSAEDDGLPGGDLTSEWSLTEGPEGATFGDASSLETTFTFQRAGAYVLRLDVTDSELTGSDTVTIIVNHDPVAAAGEDAVVAQGGQVILDAGGSSDPDEDDTLSYRWSQTEGPSVVLVDSDEEQARFTAPAPPAVLVFQVRVTDSRGGSATDDVTITVNSPPVAEAGEDRTVNGGQRVTLDATASSDADGSELTFVWRQLDGPRVTLANAATDTATFTSPMEDSELVFEVIVVDEHDARATDTVTITVTLEENLPPRADAGRDRNVVEGLVVTLNASASSDPNGGDTLSYLWEQTAGAEVTLSDGASEKATLTVPDGADSLAFQVTVRDGFGEESTAGVTLTVVQQPKARLKTSLGVVVIELLIDDAPVTSLNFLRYIDEGFYNGTVFHRIVPDFVVQGGGFLPDGSKQTGGRDPIVNEFDPQRSNVRGTVAMAKLGGDPDSATSEFFFNLADNSENLDNQNGGFTVFANVIEGMDVVDAMAAVELDGESPVEDIVLESATIE